MTPPLPRSWKSVVRAAELFGPAIDASLPSDIAPTILPALLVEILHRQTLCDILDVPQEWRRCPASGVSSTFRGEKMLCRRPETKSLECDWSLYAGVHVSLAALPMVVCTFARWGRVFIPRA